MSWNYRVMKQTLATGEDWFSIREAYYHKREDEEPHSWTAGDSAPGAETLEGLVIELERMLEATKKRALEDTSPTAAGPDAGSFEPGA